MRNNKGKELSLGQLSFLKQDTINTNHYLKDPQIGLSKD